MENRPQNNTRPQNQPRFIPRSQRSMAQLAVSEDLVFISGQDFISRGDIRTSNTMQNIGGRISDMLF